MLEFSGQMTTPDRFSYHTGPEDMEVKLQLQRGMAPARGADISSSSGLRSCTADAGNNQKAYGLTKLLVTYIIHIARLLPYPSHLLTANLFYSIQVFQMFCEFPDNHSCGWVFGPAKKSQKIKEIISTQIIVANDFVAVTCTL